MNQDSNPLCEEIDKLWKRLRPLNQHLGNLLAVIHQDGGHYQQEVGTEKACKEAEHAVCGLRADIELRDDKIRDLEAELAKEREARAELVRGVEEVVEDMCFVSRWAIKEKLHAIAREGKG